MERSRFEIEKSVETYAYIPKVCTALARTIGFSSYTRTLKISMIETDLLKDLGAEGDLARRSTDTGVLGADAEDDEGLFIVRSLLDNQEGILVSY